MTTNVISSDYRFDAGETLAFTDGAGFKIDQGGIYPFPPPLHFTLAGTAEGTASQGTTWGVLNAWSQPGSTIEIADTGVLRITGQAYGASAYGVEMDGPAGKFINHGTLEVTTGWAAEGLWSQGQVDVQNTGHITVSTSQGGAAGVMVGGGAFTNSGAITVNSLTGGVGVAIGYIGYSSFTNSGEIRAHESDARTPSIGVSWNAQVLGGGASFVNSGIIEGDYALKVTEPFGGANGTVVFVNMGHMYGAVDMGSGDSLLNNDGGEIVGSLSLGLGADTYGGAAGVVWGSIDGGDGNDVIWGGLQGESITGGNGADTIHGGGGADLISGGRDSDLLDGGAGNDGVFYEDATMGVNLDFASSRANTAGEDTLTSIELAFGSHYADTLAGSAGVDTLSGEDGADQVFGRMGDDSLAGGEGQDYLRGDEGADSLSGGADFDDINGNQGNDSVSGGAGDDWVVGGRDDDRLAGDEGGDIVYGNLGNDSCDGGADADLVRGGQGDDVVLGGAGDDWLSGDRGSDTLTGGAGADTFHSFGDAGLDVVTDFNAAEGDHVQLDAGSAYTSYQSGADTIIDFGGGNEMVLQGVQLSGLPSGWIVGA